jgi:hypothetical protein
MTGSREATKNMAPKIKGKPACEHEGLEIYVNPAPAKSTKGKDRVWIHIRQNDPKKWREETALIYVNAADIRFVRR